MVRVATVSTMTDWATVYRDCVDAIAQVADGLTPDQAATVVPATPLWTVQDVFAHSAGAPADAVSGRMDGAPAPPWTARHVAERRGLTIPELVAEMRATQDAAIQLNQGSERPALVWDKAVHLADLHEALGLGIPPESTWRPVVDQVGPWRLAGLPAVEAPAYEVFRGVFSRRSRAQLSAWAWSTAPTDEQLDGLGIFGPRDDDQPIP